MIDRKIGDKPINFEVTIGIFNYNIKFYTSQSYKGATILTQLLSARLLWKRDGWSCQAKNEG